MGFSVIDAQRDIILNTLRSTTQGQWKVLILDEFSRKLIDNVLQHDDILNEHITHIEYIEDKRQTNRDVDAIYLLTAKPHIVDCIMADFEKRRYRRCNLIWTSLPHANDRARIDKSTIAREQIATFKVLNIDFYPRESHLVTFRDPWEFPVLFHPGCNTLVRQHMEGIARKIVGVCVALGEYPIIRYYKPVAPRHEASVLCAHMARFVQDELDLYAKYHNDFPPASNRPRASLYITDRSMDVISPLLHEFTYQAMAFDLLPIREGDKVTYKTIVNEGRHDEEIKDVEITEKDRIWMENRHRHMKDTIEKLMGDFQKFIDSNPHFTKSDSENATSLNAIKDMMAGLPQFQEMKEAYSLHLSMAQECMNIFQKRNLPDVAFLEQILATGLDDDYRKPKHLTDMLVRTLDDDNVKPSDRLRILALYLVYRDGLLPADLQKLMYHSQLQESDLNVLQNLSLLGISTSRGLKDTRAPPPSAFPFKPPLNPTGPEEYPLSRYEPGLRQLLAAHANGTLDPQLFAYTKPPLEADSGLEISATSMRTAKPTWAKKTTSNEPRQRVIVYVAGGATYSETRACYEASAKHNKDVVLVTSHMQTPTLFTRQVGDLTVDRRRLGIPADAPKPQAPAHLFEREAPPPQVPQHRPHTSREGQPASEMDRAARMRPPEPPTAAMAGMRLDTKQNGGPSVAKTPVSTGKLSKENPEEKKKKKHFFSKSK